MQICAAVPKLGAKKKKLSADKQKVGFIQSQFYGDYSVGEVQTKVRKFG